jgi:hypothetical protein
MRKMKHKAHEAQRGEPGIQRYTGK